MHCEPMPIYMPDLGGMKAYINCLLQWRLRLCRKMPFFGMMITAWKVKLFLACMQITAIVLVGILLLCTVKMLIDFFRILEH